jgi:hypothetical protein
VAAVGVAEALIVVVAEDVAEAAVVEEDPGIEIRITDLITSKTVALRSMDNRLHPNKPSLLHHTANPHTSNNSLLSVCPNHSRDTRSIPSSSNNLSLAKVKHPRHSPSSSPSSNRLRSQTPSRPFRQALTSTLFSWLHCNSSSSSSSNTNSHSNNTSSLNKLPVSSRKTLRP